MSARFALCALAFLAFLAVIDGCDKKSTKPKHLHRKSREIDDPIAVGRSGFGLLLRPRNDAKDVSMNIGAERVFTRIDANSNDVIDAAEWVDFCKETSVWDFLELLDYADIDDDETLSFEEFFSVQIVKLGQSDKEKDGVSLTSPLPSVER